MPLLLLLALPVCEVLVALSVADEIGFMNTIGLLLLAMALGILLMKLTGRTFLIELQMRAARGEDVGKIVFSQSLRFLAGLLFLIPGFVTDAMAIFTILASFVPGLFIKGFNRNAKRWGSRFVVFTNGTGGPVGGQWTTYRGPGPRDVTPEDPRVIDVSPEKTDRSD